MPHPSTQIAGVLATCAVLVLVWVAAILVARALLGGGQPRSTAALTQQEQHRPPNSGNRPRPGLAASRGDLDRSLTGSRSESHPGQKSDR